MIHRLLRTALPALFMLGLAAPAHAFRLVPIEMEFAPSGRGATQTFRLENDSADPAAVELHMMTRRMNERGEDQLTDAPDGSFLVFPEQVVLQPNQSQSVRVQWTGAGDLKKELPFRLVAEQLPVDLGRAPPKGGQVRLLMRYIASVYVTPPNAKAQLVVTGAEPRGKQLEVTVENRGSMRQILREPVLRVQAGGKTVDLRGEQLAGLSGENVLASTVRRFLIPLPSGIAQGPLSASLTLPTP